MKTYTPKRRQRFNNYMIEKYNFNLWPNTNRLIKGELNIEINRNYVFWIHAPIGKGETDGFKPSSYNNMQELYDDIFKSVIQLYDTAYYREKQIDSILND